jgi:membrane-bound lytic murein transglycosylase B
MAKKIQQLLVLLLISSTLMFLGLPKSIQAANPSQTELEQQLAQIEQEIANYEKQLTQTVTQKNTLNNKIKQLNLQKKELTALIKQTTLKINKLAGDITTAQTALDNDLAKEAQLKQQVSILLQLINQQEIRPLFLLTSAKGFSSVFIAIKNYLNLSSQLKIIIDQVQKLEQEIINKKNNLEKQKTDNVNLLQIKSIQNKQLVSTIGEQTSLLNQTKGQEANYNKILTDKKQQAAQIRSRIYELFNSGSQINFGQAVEIANWAKKLTGIDPAFLLAILTQESNLGKNVGTCNRSGDPPEKSWKVIMKPERDQEPFKKIIEELGLNIDTTPVSCPAHDTKGNQIGWGGAMGPAQFIPSTWMGYKNKVTKLTGKSTANPWDIRDAFIAAAIKLTGNGATGTEQGNWNAAMIYFSGSTNTRYRFYGDNVIAIAKKYQADIENLSN